IVLVALGVAVDRSQHPGPRFAHDQQAALVGADALAVAGDDVGGDSGQWIRGRAGLGGDRPGHRAYHDPAGLGLPPRIDDWAPLAADNFAVPHPRFGIDRLSHRTKQSQTRQVMLFYPRVAPFYESPDGSGRGVEDADAVLRYYPPEAIVLGEIRRAFIHYDRRARRQRPVHGVTVAGYPPDIRRAPVDVVLLQVEHPLHRHQDMSQVPAGRMHDALGFAGRAAGVEGVERMLGVELGGLAAGVVRGNELVPPQVAPFAHLDLVADPLEHDDFLDRWALFQRLIDIVLELDDLPAAPSAVRGN